MNKPRNLAARSPVLRKGGVHERSKSARRFQGKQALAAVLDALCNHGSGSQVDAEARDRQLTGDWKRENQRRHGH